jgi:Spy/CpxP family protein refolding chaperone
MNEKEEKMKSGQIILSALALGATLGWTAPQAWADGGCGAHQGPGERPCHHETMMTHHACAGDHLHHLLKHQKEIGLTDEQVMKLKAIDLDLDRARIRGEADIRVAERELQALLEDEKTDLAALETKVKQSEMLEVGVRMAGLTARRDALAVLTPEQRDKAKAAHERLRDQKKSGQHQDHGERPTRP